MTKQFTAMGIMTLQDRGLLGVGDPVGDHVDGLPAAWRPLTIHELLTHTSGIMHSWALPGFRETMAVPTTLDETLERFFDEPLLYPAGSDYTYSGVGYFLLAKVVESVSGQAYGDFLDNEVFGPLGMTSSGVDHPAVILTDRASGYGRNDSGDLVNADDIFMPLLTGGGNIYSTVEDLARWSEALRNHALVSDTAYAAMYTPELQQYGYGWRVTDRDGERSLEHTGSVSGFLANIVRIPSRGFALVLLSNTTPANLRGLGDSVIGVVLEPTNR